MTQGHYPRHSMSMYASKDDMLAAVMRENEELRARIAELESELEAVGAGGVEPLRKQTQLAEVQQGVPSDAEIGQAIDGFDWEGWIDQRKALRTFVKECLQRFKTTHHTQQGMEQDAARYRWLRKSPNPACDIALAKHFGGGRGQDFDALIDAAIAAKAKQGEQQ